MATEITSKASSLERLAANELKASLANVEKTLNLLRRLRDEVPEVEAHAGRMLQGAVQGYSALYTVQGDLLDLLEGLVPAER